MPVRSGRAPGQPAANGLGPEIARGPSSLYRVTTAPPGTAQLAANTSTTRARARKRIAASLVMYHASHEWPTVRRWRLRTATGAERSTFSPPPPQRGPDDRLGRAAGVRPPPRMGCRAHTPSPACQTRPMAVRRIMPYHESPDFEATRAFYTRVLGLEEGSFGGGYIGFGSGQAQVVFAPPGVEPVLPDMGVDVGSRRAVDAAHAEAVRAGHDVIYGPVDEPWGVRRFFVRDPHGVVISVLAHE